MGRLTVVHRHSLHRPGMISRRQSLLFASALPLFTLVLQNKAWAAATDHGYPEPLLALMANIQQQYLYELVAAGVNDLRPSRSRIQVGEATSGKVVMVNNGSRPATGTFSIALFSPSNRRPEGHNTYEIDIGANESIIATFDDGPSPATVGHKNLLAITSDDFAEAELFAYLLPGDSSTDAPPPRKK